MINGNNEDYKEPKNKSTKNNKINWKILLLFLQF